MSKYLEATTNTERGLGVLNNFLIIYNSFVFYRPHWIQECRDIFYNSLSSQSFNFSEDGWQ
jgi:hypothetical protein